MSRYMIMRDGEDVVVHFEIDKSLHYRYMKQFLEIFVESLGFKRPKLVIKPYSKRQTRKRIQNGMKMLEAVQK